MGKSKKEIEKEREAIVRKWHDYDYLKGITSQEDVYKMHESMESKYMTGNTKD